MKQYFDFYIPNCVVVYEESKTEHGTTTSWVVIDRTTGKVVNGCTQDKRLSMREFTPEELEEARKMALSLKSTAPFQNAYIRFGDLPKSGYSKNYATGKNELGISCYRAVWDLQSEAYCPVGYERCFAMFKYLNEDAPIYLITGNEAGEGGDGEPVLNNTKVLAELQFNPNGQNYKILNVVTSENNLPPCSSIWDSTPHFHEEVMENHHADILFNYPAEVLGETETASNVAQLDLYKFIQREVKGLKTVQDIKDRFAVFAVDPEAEFEIEESFGENKVYSPICEIGPDTLPHIPHIVHFRFTADVYDGIVHVNSTDLLFIAGQEFEILYDTNKLTRYVNI